MSSTEEHALLQIKHKQQGKDSMANNVIGLFENRSVADKVAQELLAAGFSERNLNRYEGS